MLRSLHMKLVMIMVLLILSLMTVVGAFLINSVVVFYMEEFYTQMADVFARESLSRDLTTQVPGEEDGAQAILEVIRSYSGELGLDGTSRTLYILDGETGGYLTGTDDQQGKGLEYNSVNLTKALSERDMAKAMRIADHFARNPKDNPLLVTMSALFTHFQRIFIANHEHERIATDPWISFPSVIMISCIHFIINNPYSIEI